MSEKDATFNPFNSHIEEKIALQCLQKGLVNSNDGELFIEHRNEEVFLFDDRTLKSSTFNKSEGFGMRAVNGENVSYAHSSTISKNELEKSAEIVKAFNNKNNKISSSPTSENRDLYSKENPINSSSFEDKINILKEIDDYSRTINNKVKQVSINLGSSLQEIIILRPDGKIIKDIRPMSRINVSIIVENNGKRESSSSGSGGRFNLSKLMEPSTWKKHVNEAIRVAILNLEALEAPAGVKDVVLGPGWPGVLLHEAVGHGLEGDFNRKKTSAFSDRIGKIVASENVTIVDDGTLKNRRGSINFDDEGTPSKKNILIKDGILQNYMQDRLNGKLMGGFSSGNGRRQSYAHVPMPRMTNTFMTPGSENPKLILENLQDGIHAVGFSGGQVDITNGKFVFSCTEAYLVKNGKILHPIKGATLIGDGPTALTKIKSIGNDLELDPGIGNCGKKGQWVPVGVGQPTVMISGLTIGGSLTN